MLKIKDFVAVLEKLAPLSLSQKMIERGAYDNSGIIIRNNDSVENVLFSLDLSKQVVLKAVEFGCDTIVTHHPAIYSPISNLDAFGETADVLFAARSGLNVISFHLNLDVAQEGIDFYLAKSLGAENEKIIEVIDENIGYGREFFIDRILTDFVREIKVNLGTDKVIFYGEDNVKSVASFCGAGGGSILEYARREQSADTIISSDLSHHVIKELIEKGKKVIIIPHYVAEDFGFNKFYERIKDLASGSIRAYYFEDKRFK